MDRHREINDDCARRWLAELEQLKAEHDRIETDKPVSLLLAEARAPQPDGAEGGARRR